MQPANKNSLLGIVALVACGLGLIGSGAACGHSPAREDLGWESTAKKYVTTTNDTSAPFSFAFTNYSSHEIVILDATPSCGCTMVKMPPVPWRIKPGGAGTITASVDLKGKSGRFSKTINVNTSQGLVVLALSVEMPFSAEELRMRGADMAHADRQAVFKNLQCAACHKDPGNGQEGAQLYHAICAICHEARERASAVPDLTAIQKQLSRTEWAQWIRDGKEGTMMPAFAESAGGPLGEKQVESLVSFLFDRFDTSRTRKVEIDRSRPDAIRLVPQPTNSVSKKN